MAAGIVELARQQAIDESTKVVYRVGEVAKASLNAAAIFCGALTLKTLNVIVGDKDHVPFEED